MKSRKGILMNAFISSCFITVLSMACLAGEKEETAISKSPVPGVSDAEWSALPPRERMMRAVGGMIPNKTSGEGCIVVLDAQKIVLDSFLKSQAARLEDVSWFRVKYDKADSDLNVKGFDAAIKKANGNVTIVVVDNDSLPRLILLPETRAAVVNVRALKADDQKKTEDRISKEMSRAFGFIFGVMVTDRPGVMDAVASVDDLDQMLVDVVTQDVVFSIERTADRFGLKRFGRIMYKNACERGIAPVPKNKWQQRIYDEVKAQKEKGAVKGVKIKYDPKSGK